MFLRFRLWSLSTGRAKVPLITVGRYLLGTRDKGTVMRPMTDKDLDMFVDASFCGDWDPKEAASDRDTARSRHGNIINYAGCPLLWKSQLPTEVALLSTEREYTGLNYALRGDAIPVMELLKKMKNWGYPISTTQALVHCCVFKDNSGALEMARVHKYQPRTKYLNVPPSFPGLHRAKRDKCPSYPNK
jgi:hypothetical protein